MIDQIITWANNNQGLVAVLLFIFGVVAAIIGYLIKHFLFGDRPGNTLKQKQKGGDDAENYQAGGDINIRK